MKIIIFSGTPEEFLKIKAHLPVEVDEAASEAKSDVSSSSEASPFGPGFASGGLHVGLVGDLQLVLRRRKLSNKFKELAKILYDHGSEGINYYDLLEKLSMGGKELGGMIGAFARRLKNTFSQKNYDVYEHFLHVDEDGWRYSLIPEARTALELEGLV